MVEVKMNTTDPIADMLTRIRNAILARHESVSIPASKIKLSIAKILKREGFVTDYEVLRSKPHRTIKIYLKYTKGKKPVLTGLRRISKPSIRVYHRSDEIPKVYGGIGIAILSTPKGVMTGREAWQERVGGEILCYVW